MKPLSYNPRDPWAVLNSRGDEEVCRVIGGDTSAECHAYARLFAAAPELLVALRGIVDLQGKISNRLPLSESDVRDWAAANHTIRAAISAAIGDKEESNRD